MSARIGERSRPPHVVILVENLPVPLDRRVWNEAVALRAAGWRVSVVGPRGPRDMRAFRDVRDGITLYRYPQRAATGLAGYLVEYLPSLTFTALWLLWIRLHRQIDVIHGCNPPDLLFLFGALARARGGAYVFDQHDVNPELSETKWGRSGVKGLLYRLTLALERASYRTASLVIVVNEAYASIARRRGAVPEEALAIVPNAPDRDAIREHASAAPPPADDGPFRVGYLGVMGSQDGIDRLIEACAHVQDLMDRRLTLDLVGDGEARARLTRLAAQRGVDAVFHGYAGAEVYAPLLAGCHVLVCPDPPTPFNRVSTMTKVVDYLAIGRPIVSFALDETTRLVGPAGVVVEPPTAEAMAAALVDLARQPGRLATLALASSGRLDVIGLSWAHSAETLVGAYDRLLDDLRHRPGTGDGSRGV